MKDAERGEGGQGWVRVGRYDGPRRRALWVRVNLIDKSTLYLESHNVSSIELCSGREGGDAHVTLLPDNPAFGDMLNVLRYAADHIGGLGS